jgi:hypothetical protein
MMEEANAIARRRGGDAGASLDPTGLGPSPKKHLPHGPNRICVESDLGHFNAKLNLIKIKAHRQTHLLPLITLLRSIDDGHVAHQYFLQP